MVTVTLEPCGSQTCSDPAAVEVFWPGQTLKMCRLCAMKATTVANAIGLPLEVRPLSKREDQP